MNKPWNYRFCILFTITPYMLSSSCRHHRCLIYTHYQPLKVVCNWVYQNSNSNMIIISWLSKEAQYYLSFGDCEILVCFTKYRCLEITSGKMFYGRSQWLCNVRHMSASAQLLGLWVDIALGHGCLSLLYVVERADHLFRGVLPDVCVCVYVCLILCDL
jgi:hypothetical protein